MTTETPIVVEEPRVVEPARGPGDWARKNLFNNWYNTLFTLVFGRDLRLGS